MKTQLWRLSSSSPSSLTTSTLGAHTHIYIQTKAVRKHCIIQRTADAFKHYAIPRVSLTIVVCAVSFLAKNQQTSLARNHRRIGRSAGKLVACSALLHLYIFTSERLAPSAYQINFSTTEIAQWETTSSWSCQRKQYVHLFPAL